MTDLAGCNILIVEDEEIIATTLEDLLREEGCTIIGPASGIDDALARVRDDTLDAAILDLNIGGGQSFSVADALHDRNVPFLFSTGADPVGLNGRYPRSAVLRKPFRPRDVLTALRKILFPEHGEHRLA